MRESANLCIRCSENERIYIKNDKICLIALENHTKIELNQKYVVFYCNFWYYLFGIRKNPL